VKKFWAFVAIYLCWGGTFLAIRYVVAEMPPLLAIALRCAGGAAVLLLWLAARRQLRPTDWPQWRTALYSGVFLFLGCHGILAWAEQRVASGEAALLLTSIPLWMVGLDAARRRTLPRPRVLLGLAIGVLGVAVLSIGGEGWSGGWFDRLGLLLSGLCWAIGSLIGRHGARSESAAQATAMQLTGGTLALLLVSLVLGEWGRWEPAAVTLRGLLALAFLILGGTVIGFAAYTWLLRVASPGAVSSYAFVNPVIALLLAWAVGDGRLTAQTGLAGLLVLAAVGCVREARSTGFPSRSGWAWLQPAARPARNSPAGPAGHS
jgi:drug/metabolite transporter (DMT)-like permease